MAGKGGDLMLEFIKAHYTFIFALVGFLLSVYNFLREWLQSRNRINLIYRCHWTTDRHSTKLIFHLMLENKSKNDVSISRMFLVTEKEKIEFLYPPSSVLEFEERNRHGEIKANVINTVAIPFTINGLGVVGGYFKVRVSSECAKNYLNSGNAKILVHTNRGKKMFSFVTNDSSDDIQQYGDYS